MTVIDHRLYPRMDSARVVSLILWPISVLMIAQRTLVMAVNGARTDDFTTVYNASLNILNRQPVYAENLTTVDPHYLYPPSGTLLMAPLAYLNPEHSRWVFIAASTVALLICAYLLVRLFGLDPAGWALPVVLFFFFSTETVSNTLIFTNFNAFVLLGLIAFLLLLRDRQDLWAGVFIGLTLAVKPVLAPLLLLPLLQLRWKVFVTALGLPLVLNALAWPLIVDSRSFVDRTLPYLLETRNYYNSSLSGVGLYFGIDGWLVTLLRIAFVAMAAYSLWFLWRHYRETDELLWLATSSGVLLATTFLVGSLGQGYYSMLLFPLLMTVVRPGSVMRNWPAWAAVYACMSFDSFFSKKWDWLGRYMEYGAVTLGWGLLMVVTFCVLLFRHLDLRAAQRAGAAAAV